MVIIVVIVVVPTCVEVEVDVMLESVMVWTLEGDAAELVIVEEL